MFNIPHTTQNLFSQQTKEDNVNTGELSQTEADQLRQVIKTYSSCFSSNA